MSRRSTSSVGLAVLATLVLATSVSAAPPNWTAPETIRERNNLSLNDADFSGSNVAISWQEPTSGAPRIGVATQVEGGFGPLEFISGSRESSVDICGSALYAAWERKVAPGKWRVVYSDRSIDMNDLHSGIQQVAPGPDTQKLPDIACTNARVFVTWYQPESGGDRMFVAHRLYGDFSDPIDLGLDDETFFFNSLAVSAVNNAAYTVFQRSDGDLRLKRFTIGAGLAFNVTPHATQVIAPGTINDPASYAVIDAEGSKVAVAWFRCNALYARVSNDRGQTWGPIRKLLDTASCDGDFAAAPNSIAIDGSKIVVTYSAASAFGGGWIGLFRTNNDFASFSDDMITSNFHPEHLVGYVTVAGVTKLAAAFERPGVIRFRRQK